LQVVQDLHLRSPLATPASELLFERISNAALAAQTTVHRTRRAVEPLLEPLRQRAASLQQNAPAVVLTDKHAVEDGALKLYHGLRYHTRSLADAYVSNLNHVQCAPSPVPRSI
jgi:hypothetical protein